MCLVAIRFFHIDSYDHKADYETSFLLEIIELMLSDLSDVLLSGASSISP